MLNARKDRDNILTPADAASVIRVLRPGGLFVYHIGDLSMDRAETDARGRHTPRASKIDALANFMLKQGAGEFSFGDGASVTGHDNGTLTRIRVSENRYLYVFQKTGNIKK